MCIVIFRYFNAILFLLLFVYVKSRSSEICKSRKMHIPNPRDPYSFYKCAADGSPVLFKCPLGTRFDKSLEICNWDRDVPIGPGTGDNGGTIGEGGGQTGPGTSGNESDGGQTGPGTGENGQETNPGTNGMDCSMNMEGPTRLYQDPEDCSAFYTCNMGRPVLTYCPRGLFFNPIRGGCENTVPEGCQLVDPNKPGGGPIFEEQRWLRLKKINKW